MNVIFHILHLFQTHVTYDGTAQDVVSTSAQCSIIMLLCFVILLEFSERGAIFGWPNAKTNNKASKALRLNLKPVYLIRKYHGYAFAWGAIYTFWYHPMENTYGHAVGFFYTWMILLQGSLMYTQFHMNCWWRLLMESWFILYGGIVAYQTQTPSDLSKWPMFVFGPLLVFAFTWVFILDFWHRITAWARLLPPMIAMGITAACFTQIKDEDGQLWVRLPEITYIPAVFYGGFLFAWLILYFFLWIEMICTNEKSPEPSVVRQISCISAFLVIYAGLIGISVALDLEDVPSNHFGGLYGLIFIFLFVGCVGTMLIKHAMPIKKRTTPSYNKPPPTISGQVSFIESVEQALWPEQGQFDRSIANGSVMNTLDKDTYVSGAEQNEFNEIIHYSNAVNTFGDAEWVIYEVRPEQEVDIDGGMHYQSDGKDNYAFVDDDYVEINGNHENMNAYLTNYDTGFDGPTYKRNGSGKPTTMQNGKVINELATYDGFNEPVAIHQGFDESIPIQHGVDPAPIQYGVTKPIALQYGHPVMITVSNKQGFHEAVGGGHSMTTFKGPVPKQRDYQVAQGDKANIMGEQYEVDDGVLKYGVHNEQEDYLQREWNQPCVNTVQKGLHHEWTEAGRAQNVYVEVPGSATYYEHQVDHANEINKSDLEDGKRPIDHVDHNDNDINPDEGKHYVQPGQTRYNAAHENDGDIPQHGVYEMEPKQANNNNIKAHGQTIHTANREGPGIWPGQTDNVHTVNSIRYAQEPREADIEFSTRM